MRETFYFRFFFCRSGAVCKCGCMPCSVPVKCIAVIKNRIEAIRLGAYVNFPLTFVVPENFSLLHFDLAEWQHPQTHARSAFTLIRDRLRNNHFKSPKFLAIFCASVDGVCRRPKGEIFDLFRNEKRRKHNEMQINCVFFYLSLLVLTCDWATETAYRLRI